ncbi:bifunctional DNA primase/polymerase [Gemmatimonadota bacterium]
MARTQGESQGDPSCDVMKDAAIAYAKWFQFTVLPLYTPEDGGCLCDKHNCGSPGKHPIAESWSEASSDPAVVEHLWNDYPSANVGVLTGAKSGIAVLDVDPRNGGDESLDALLLEYGKLPDTPTVLTGGGGQHYYFMYPSGFVLRSMKLRPGLDFKADGGLVVAPPSRHVSGNEYVWEVSSHIDGGPCAPVPEWLAELTQRPERDETPREAPTPDDIQKTVESVRKLCPERARDYDTALQVGMAIHAAMPDATGFTLFKEFCQRSPEKFAEDTDWPATKWDTFNASKPRGVGVGSLVKWAREDAVPSVTTSKSRGIIIRASNVVPEPVQWLWHNRIPRGKLTGIIGNPDRGKSTLLLDLAARVSTGKAMPDRAPVKAGGIVVLSAEDGAADTIVPRLIAAGADLNRVGLLTGITTGNGPSELVLPEHLDALRDAVTEYNAAMVIVDPLNAYLTGTVNSWRDHDVRRALRPLATFAEETHTAVVVLRHVTKAEHKKAIHAASGSIGITGAARAEHLVAEDPDDSDRNIFAPVKANLAPRQPSLVFRLEGTTIETSAGVCSVARIVWCGESSHSADDLVSMTDPEERSALADAREFLLDVLRDGPRLAEEVTQEARQSGISNSTLKRAKRECKVKASRRGFGKGGKWWWELPSTSQSYENEEREAIMAESDGRS